MAYSIKIYNPNFSGVLTTIFFGNDFYDFNWSLEINKPGGCRFTMKNTNLKATPTNLKLWNKIIVYKDSIPKFVGYIESIKVTKNEISLDCPGIFGYFKKRVYSGSISSQTLVNSIFSILNSVNATYDTGINTGDYDLNLNSQIVDGINLQRLNALSAWQKILDTVNAEIEIDGYLNLNIRTKLGEDKTDTIVLRYINTQLITANLLDFEIDIEGKDMANAIYGISKDSNGDDLTSVQTDSDSILAFGRLDMPQSFEGARSQVRLDEETEGALVNVIEEFYAPRITLDTTKVSEEDINLGDIVRVVIENGFVSLDRNDRIIKKTVNVQESGQESVQIELLPDGRNKLPSNFIKDIISLQNRVALLENS